VTLPRREKQKKQTNKQTNIEFEIPFGLRGWETTEVLRSSESDQSCVLKRVHKLMETKGAANSYLINTQALKTG